MNQASKRSFQAVIDVQRPDLIAMDWRQIVVSIVRGSAHIRVRPV